MPDDHANIFAVSLSISYCSLVSGNIACSMDIN